MSITQPTPSDRESSNFDQKKRSFLLSINSNPDSNILKWGRKLNKDEVRSLGIHSDRSYRVSRNFDISSLAEFIKEGNLIVPSLQDGGGNVIQSSIIIIDVDNPNPGLYPIKDHLGLLGEYVAIAYPSPSFDLDQNSKQRVIFVLSREVCPDEVIIRPKHEGFEEIKLYRAIVEDYLQQFFPKYSDPGKPDRGFDLASAKDWQFYWSALDPNSVECFENASLLDVDEIRELLLEKYNCSQPDAGWQESNFHECDIHEIEPPPDSWEKVIPINKGRETKDSKNALTYIAKHIWQGVCDRNPNKFYCLYEHQLQPEPLESGMNCNFVGRLFGSKNPEGSGMWVYSKDIDYPPVMVDRSDSVSKSFIEYWRDCKVYSGDYPDSISLKGKDFKKVVNDICNYFNVKPFFEKENLQEVFDQILEKFQNDAPRYIFKCKWEHKRVYFYYSFKSGCWFIASDYSLIYEECIQYFLLEIVSKELLNDPKVEAYIHQLFYKGDVFDHLSQKINFDLLRKTEIIPFANGDFNTQTKVFSSDYRFDIYNQVRSQISYREVPQESEGLAIFFNWINTIYEPQEKDLLLAWIIANCYGRATETTRMTNFFGTPKTGKSTILKLLKSSLGHDLSYSANTENFVSEGNRFSFQCLDGRHAILLDEFSPTQAQWRKLKEISGSAYPHIEIEQKGLKPYPIILRAALTTTTQDHIWIPATDDGGIRRRLRPIKHTLKMHNPKFARIEDEVVQPKVYESVFLWAIAQNCNDAIATIRRYDDTYLQETLREIVIENDKHLMFMHEMLIFTNCETDVVSNIELQQAFTIWMEHEHGEIVDKNKAAKVSQFIRAKAQIPENRINWTLCPKKGQDLKVKDARGQFVRGLKGIKIRAFSDLSDLSGIEGF